MSARNQQRKRARWRSASQEHLELLSDLLALKGALDLAILATEGAPSAADDAADDALFAEMRKIERGE